MLKEFIVEVRLEGHIVVEDPRCPSEWRGSGCYDKHIKKEARAEVEVWADTELQARSFVENCDKRELYSGYEVSLDDFSVEGVRYVYNLGERSEEEAGITGCSDIVFKEI